MKKRLKIIVPIVAVIVLLVLFWFWVLAPRVALKKAIDEFLPSLDKSAEYFTEFDAKPDFKTKSVNNGFFSVDIPETFTLKEEAADVLPLYITQDMDNYEFVILPEEFNDEAVVLMNSRYFEDMENVPDNVDLKSIEKGYKKLGYGIPNTEYNTYKCIALLKSDDYSFWDLEKAVVFSVTAILKEIVYYDAETLYIYEKDDICGIIQINRYVNEEVNFDGYQVIFEMYSTDDLNTSYTLMLGMQSLDDIYAIINSVEIVK